MSKAGKTAVLILAAAGCFAYSGVLINNYVRAQTPRPERSEVEEKLRATYDFSDALIDVNLLFAPGVPQDGIPALTTPPRVKVSEAEYPLPDGRVVEVVIGGEAVAYPLGILNFHEIVNDVVGGRAIAATYCPLCDSVSAFDRTIEGADGTKTVLEFGVSGFLYNSNVMMYERSTNGLWSQVMMRCVTGPHAGRKLGHLPVRVVAFEDFAKRHPDGVVLTTDTGHERPYSKNPYESYFKSSRVFHEFEHDERLPAKELGLGIRAGKTIVFVPAAAVMGESLVVETALGPLTVISDAAGVRVEELPEGADTIQTFYHSWAAFYPMTRIVPEPEAGVSEEE